MGAHSPQNSARACRFPNDGIRLPDPAALFIGQAPANTPPGFTSGSRRGVCLVLLAEPDMKGVTLAHYCRALAGAGVPLRLIS
jgi:hypothetical protein